LVGVEQTVSMEAKLIVVSGKANKGEVALNLPTVIGRSRDVELTVAHPMISRQHCEIYEVDGLLMIRDLGSLNGTVVAGQQIREAPLRPGDELTVGPLTFRAEYEYEGDLDSLPPAKLAEQESGPAEVATEAGVPDLQSVEETPSFGADAEVPDFSFFEASDDKRVAEIPDFEAMAAEAVAEPPPDETRDEQTEEIEIIEEIDEVEDTEGAEEVEEEEPEPAPPPAAKKTPPAAGSRAASGNREASVEAIDVDDLDVLDGSGSEPKSPVPKPSKQAARPAAPKLANKAPEVGPEKQHPAAKQAESRKGKDVADSLGATDAERRQGSTAESKDDELDDFLKAL